MKGTPAARKMSKRNFARRYESRRGALMEVAVGRMVVGSKENRDSRRMARKQAAAGRG